MFNLVFEKHFFAHGFEHSLVDFLILPYSIEVKRELYLFWYSNLRHEHNLFELVCSLLEHSTS